MCNVSVLRYPSCLEKKNSYWFSKSWKPRHPKRLKNTIVNQFYFWSKISWSRLLSQTVIISIRVFNTLSDHVWLNLSLTSTIFFQWHFMSSTQFWPDKHSYVIYLHISPLPNDDAGSKSEHYTSLGEGWEKDCSLCKFRFHYPFFSFPQCESVIHKLF